MSVVGAAESVAMRLQIKPEVDAIIERARGTRGNRTFGTSVQPATVTARDRSRPPPIDLEAAAAHVAALVPLMAAHFEGAVDTA